MALTKLTSNLIEGGTGTDWVTAIQTSNFTAAAGKGYFVNTTSQILYVNLPVGVVGMEITIQDYAGTFGTNKVVLNANGSEKIQGSALEGRINTNNATAVLIYQDATKGWTSQDITLNQTTISFATPTGQSLTYSTPSPQSSEGATATTFPTTTFTATKAGSIISGTATIAGLPSGITAAQVITGSGVGNTLTVTLTGTFPSTDYINTALTLSGLTVATPLLLDYLVVAGGGSGGGFYRGGGGGAGGLRTSYGNTTGGGGNAETAFTFSLSTNYTITIGGGGAANANAVGSNGTNTTFATVTSTGGGGGSIYVGSGTGAAGGTGGSGGGSGGTDGTSGAAGAAVTSPVTQGYPGGIGNSPAAPQSGGGGGGAGAAGENGGSGATAGNGGNGIQSAILSYANAGTAGVGEQISGSEVWYGGGGASGSYGSGNNATPGKGGGGDGTNSGTYPGNGTAGTSNTGGGGGGASGESPPNSGVGGAGGSGFVILRYPSSYTVSGLTQATGSPFTEGSSKVSVFTNIGTGNIQFN